MKTHEQTLTFREAPIVIDTAHGLIVIRRVDGDRRKVKIELPIELRAHVGKAQVAERSQWVELDGEHVRPKRRMLESRVSADGDLEGLGAPRPLRVGQ